MKRHARTAMLPFVFVVALGCDGPTDPGPPDVRVLWDASRVGPVDGEATDAFTPGASDAGRDASCAQTERDPPEPGQCGPGGAQGVRTRESPGPGGLADEGLEYDAARGGVQLARGTDGRHIGPGRHRSVHDGTRTCDPLTEWPYWRTLDYDVEIPEGTSLEFELRTARAEAALGAALPAIVRATSGHGVIDVSEELRRAGVDSSGPYLSVTTVLRASADGTRSPILFHYDLRYVCMAGL